MWNEWRLNKQSGFFQFWRCNYWRSGGRNNWRYTYFELIKIDCSSQLVSASRFQERHAYGAVRSEWLAHTAADDPRQRVKLVAASQGVLFLTDGFTLGQAIARRKRG